MLSNNSFTPERIIYEVVLTFESAHEIRWCDHLNETSLAVLLRGLFASPNFMEWNLEFLSILDLGLFCEWKS